MSAAPAIQIEPITQAECSAEWIEARRSIIAHCGFPLRAGWGYTIEIRSLTPAAQLATHDRLTINPWCQLILPHGAPGFATARDRDAVLDQLLRSPSPDERAPQK